MFFNFKNYFFTVVKMASYYTKDENPDEKLQKTLRLIYWFMVPILFGTLGLAWVFYPEPYEFTKEFMSNLGGYSSNDGLSNQTSSLIMAIGFGLLGLITLIVSLIYLFKRSLQYNFLKSFLNLVLAVGAGATGIPLDHPTLGFYHRMGALLFILGFAFINFVDQMLRFYRKHRLQPPTEKRFSIYH